ncbi:MAG: ATP-binding protein [Candidatus Hodarchaeota archaeon]
MSEANDKSLDMKYRKAADIINKAGQFPYPITDTLIDILKYNIREEDLDFIMAFEQNISQTMEQLKASSNLQEKDILQKVDTLAKRGVIFNQPSRTGLMIYRLLPISRQFEYTFMKKLDKTEENDYLAKLFHRFNEDIRNHVQSDYKRFKSSMNTLPPTDRTVPILENRETGKELNIIVNKELDVPKEQILPTQQIRELIEKYDDIAVGLCYCRQHNEFLGNPCKQIELIPSCFTLGKSAKHTSNHGFSKLVSKEEALKILKQCEEAGLVHKAYHLHGDSNKEEVAICNCCSCCCLTARDCLILPVANETNYLASIDHDLCIGCGTCVEKCYNNAIELLEDNKAERLEEFCIGCGVCAYFCPENAISLIEGPRIVRMIPPK